MTDSEQRELMRSTRERLGSRSILEIAGEIHSVISGSSNGYDVESMKDDVQLIRDRLSCWDHNEDVFDASVYVLLQAVVSEWNYGPWGEDKR